MSFFYSCTFIFWVGFCLNLTAQNFPISIEPEFGAKEVRLIESPVNSQILFIGGQTMVQTTATYGHEASEAPAKQWHDFIGFTEDTEDEGAAGWVSVNHERLEANDLIGDGGGMTVFKVKRSGDTLVVVHQTLEDGRSGKYFNVDFVNTVGETGMNCGGIVSTVDGRIWTAEEWFRNSNSTIYENGSGIRDTANLKLNTPEFPEYDGSEIKAFENFNWMVEIDPRQAKAIRKQYNWGRQPFESGVILPDNKTVFLGPDNTPGYFGKFVAKVAGDFTKGKLYVYKHTVKEKWFEIDNSKFDNMLNHLTLATAAGATMFNRIEWVTYDPITNAVYFSATGRDKPGSRFYTSYSLGAVVAPHHIERAIAQGLGKDGWKTEDYVDYYGRVMKYDLATDQVSVFLEGGPDLVEKNSKLCDYPETHLSNPDGLSTYVNANGRSYLIIQEDLIGDTYGRTPIGTFGNFGGLRTCEMFALDLSIKEPTHTDLIRLAIIPYGAEITGAVQTKDGKTLLVNSQHPSRDNPYPFNNSLTIAINGIDKVLNGEKPVAIEMYDINEENSFKIYPNPASRFVSFSKKIDVALYNINGERLAVYRNKNAIDVSKFKTGTYFLKTLNNKTAKLIIH